MGATVVLVVLGPRLGRYPRALHDGADTLSVVADPGKAPGMDGTLRMVALRPTRLAWDRRGERDIPPPVANAKRQVLPNPSWMGQHYERWHRTICAQVWHIGPVRIICGEAAPPLESQLTDDHIREIEAYGRSTIG